MEQICTESPLTKQFRDYSRQWKRFLFGREIMLMETDNQWKILYDMGN